MKEKQGNLRILKQLKDFDERKNQEVAARAYQEQDIMKLEVIIKTIKMSSLMLSFSIAHLSNIKSECAGLLFFI